jgi:hypothetical protein
MKSRLRQEEFTIFHRSRGFRKNTGLPYNIDRISLC